MTVKEIKAGDKVIGKQIEIELTGENKDLALHNIKCILNIVQSIKGIKKVEELNDTVMCISGYVLCCENSRFLTSKAAEELLGMVSTIAQAQEDGIKRKNADKQASLLYSIR